MRTKCFVRQTGEQNFCQSRFFVNGASHSSHCTSVTVAYPPLIIVNITHCCRIGKYKMRCVCIILAKTEPICALQRSPSRAGNASRRVRTGRRCIAAYGPFRTFKSSIAGAGRQRARSLRHRSTSDENRYAWRIRVVERPQLSLAGQPYAFIRRIVSRATLSAAAINDRSARCM
jgi:hypothetical protein